MATRGRPGGGGEKDMNPGKVGRTERLEGGLEEQQAKEGEAAW